MLQLIICSQIIRNATYMPLSVPYVMLAGLKEVQAELSQENLGDSLSSLSQTILLWCFVLPFTLLLVATRDLQALCLGNISYWHALTRHPACMLPRL